MTLLAVGLIERLEALSVFSSSKKTRPKLLLAVASGPMSPS